MNAPSFSLLFHRRFWPLFLSQSLGAIHDNLFKNALLILLVYRLPEVGLASPAITATLAGGLFIAPYFLFSAHAGALADQARKSRLMQWLKATEILIALLAGWGMISLSLPLMLAALFLLGVQATYTGPIKYAILPDYLSPSELIGGNGVLEGGTFLAILLGTIAGGSLVLLDNGPHMVAAVCLVLACAGFAASLVLPPTRSPRAPVLLFLGLGVRPVQDLVAALKAKPTLFGCVLGISWFWLVGATCLGQFPVLVKQVLLADGSVVILLLTMFSMGIAIGSVVCARLLHGEISPRLVPWAALGMGLCLLDFWLALPPSWAAASPRLADMAGFLATPVAWRLLLDLLLLSVCGGLYTVPLYALLQQHSPEDQRSRMVAANNVLNAAFMVAGALLVALLLALGLELSQVFLLLGLGNLCLSIWLLRLLPAESVKPLFALLFRYAYRLRVEGLDNLPPPEQRAVYVVNHVSFLDPALLAVALPRPLVFAINTHIARLWWIRPFLRLAETFAVDPTNPMSTKSLIRVVQQGRNLVIFPEGRLTVTGSLMKIYDGPGMIADHAGAVMVPVRIDGAEWTPFSRLGSKRRCRWFPRITLTILPPCSISPPPDMTARRQRRHHIALALYDIMSGMIYRTSPLRGSLWQALLQTTRNHGARTMALEDINRQPLSYGRLVLAALLLGRAFGRLCPGETQVGLLLPTSNAAAVSFFALQASGRVPAMLNFSTGSQAVLDAGQAAGLKTIITARRFVGQARLEPLLDALQPRMRVIFLEDIREGLGPWDKIRAVWDRAVALWSSSACCGQPDDPAVVLFTSGSEGQPKGVVLSHRNLLANCAQITARIAVDPADILFNALPVFHSFGLTGGLLLPLLSGIRAFQYPSPLHYRILPELVYDCNATILFGTDTFLTGYGRAAHPYDFYNLRLVFAGAEKLRDATRQLWMDKFGVRLLEGYGATETAPVLAVNTPMHYRVGSVGRLLPDLSWRLEPVDGIPEGGRLWVRGPNVMLGYYFVGQPGCLHPPAGGWYDTGDIVQVDEQGYVRIVGRVKRFAKVGGEMVPLDRVEQEITTLWPEFQHAVIAVPDGQKGERLVLLTTHPQPSRTMVQAHFRDRRLGELLLPRQIMAVEKIPLLGSGKVDYPAVRCMAGTAEG